MANTFNAITSGAGGIATTGDASGAFSFTKDGGSSEVYIDASGNVGIGTSSPTTKLEVSGTIATVADTNNYALLAGRYSSGFGKVAINTRGSYGIEFQANGTAVFNYDQNGLFAFNSGYGSVAVAYGCRAWVNFNGTGTIAIVSSANISSLTDNGVGNYTVNMTNAMPDSNYCGTASGNLTSNNYSYIAGVTPNSTSAFRITLYDVNGVSQDATAVQAMIVR